MRRHGLTGLLALLAAGCPGDDGPSNASTDGSTSAPSTGVETEALTSSTTTDAPTTDTPTTTTTGETDPSESSTSESTGPSDCHEPVVEGSPAVALELLADGFTQPVLVVGDPIDTDVHYVLEKGGSIKRIEPGVTTAPEEDWFAVDVTTVIESGLLSMAFHPNYESDPRIYISHNPSSEGGALVVTEFTVVDGVPDASSARDVIGAGKPEGNHNGGMVLFGPDDLLYLSLGDGGVQNDGCGHGQAGDRFLGKILRIDPDPDGAMDVSTDCAETCPCSVPGPFDYTIPRDNPFVGDDGIRDEIWAYGFRNPWRMSFDPMDGRLWVGDVGQDDWEEVDVVEAGDNGGWGSIEGLHCFNDDACDEGAPGTLNADGMRMPVIEYANEGTHCSVIGLGNYRSCEVPEWQGLYFYGDYCNGDIWAVRYDGTTVEDLGVVAQAEDSIFGGGYDANGDVFVTTAPLFGPGTTPVYRIAPAK